MAGKSKKNKDVAAPATGATRSGLVIKSTGSRYDVLLDAAGATQDSETVASAPGVPAGEIVGCKVKGHFRLMGIRTTNPVAVGDRVSVLVNADGSAYITAIEPRRNYIIRRASNLSKEASILATNLDGALLVATMKHPVTATTFAPMRFSSSRAILPKAMRGSST